MKTIRNLVLAMFAILAVCIWAGPANAQSWEVRRLLADYGWHGVGGSVQVHQPTLEASLPWVGMWQRAPRGERYGDFSYMKVLVNCDQWSQIAFATLDADYNFVLIADLTDDAPVATWPEPGTEPYRTMTAVCALFGYVRQPASLGGSASIGKIEKLSDRQPPKVQP